MDGFLFNLMQARSKENASVALPAKRKNPDVAVASTASMSTRSNKQKLDLSCTVCSITATSEKGLQDHLKGKMHMKKAARLAQPTAEIAHEDDDEVTNTIFNLGSRRGMAHVFMLFRETGHI